jgi:hypothetical protein
MGAGKILRVGEEPAPLDEGGEVSRHPVAEGGTPKGRAGGGRFGVLNRFVDCTMRRLSKNDLAVWMVLYRDTRDGVARTFESDIARRGGMSPRTVVRAVQRLVDAGLLEVLHRGSPRGGPSTYRVYPLPIKGP